MARLRPLLLFILFSLITLLPVVAQDDSPIVTPEVTVGVTTETSVISLTQTYTSEDGSVSFSYPTNWPMMTYPDEAGLYLSARIASNQNVLENNLDIFEDGLSPGQVTILLAVADVAVLAAQAGLSPDMTAEELLVALSTTADTSPDTLQFSNVGPITLGQHQGARLNATFAGEGVGMAVTYIEDGVVVLMLLNTAPGELERWEMTALDVISSVVVNPVEATPEATIDLEDVPMTEAYITADGSASFSYPADWWIDVSLPQEGVYVEATLTNTVDLLDTNPDIFGGELQPGEAVILLAAAHTSYIARQVPGLTPDVTAEELLETLTTTIDTSPEGLQFSDAAPVTVGEHHGARLNATFAGEGIGMAVVYIEDDLVVLMLLNTSPGEFEQWEMTALEIIDSVAVNPVEAAAEVTIEATEPFEPTPEAGQSVDGSALELTETYTSPDENLVLQYPSGWQVRPTSDVSLYIGSSQEAADQSFGDNFASGEAQLYIEVTSPAELGQTIDQEFTDADSPVKMLQGLVKAVGDPVGFGSVEATEVAGMPAAGVGYDNQGFSGRAWTIEYQPGTLILVQLLAAPGESQLWEATALAIAQSVVYSG